MLKFIRCLAISALMTLMMVVMLFLLGPRHPRVLYEYEPLAPGRRIIAVLALVIFILCFTPVPIDTLIDSQAR